MKTTGSCHILTWLLAQHVGARWREWSKHLNTLELPHRELAQGVDLDELAYILAMVKTP